MRILIAEDDPVSCRILEIALRREGHEVVLVEDGARAWEAFDSSPFRVVIADWVMPNVDGLELCRRIRAREETPYCYYVLITGEETSLREAMDGGVDDFLHKPLDPELLWARLQVAERILGYTKEIHELRKLLPICMFCKKIRTGVSDWTSIEEYFASHDFTHGLCESCCDEHYPEVPNRRR